MLNYTSIRSYLGRDSKLAPPKVKTQIEKPNPPKNPKPRKGFERHRTAAVESPKFLNFSVPLSLPNTHFLFFFFFLNSSEIFGTKRNSNQTMALSPSSLQKTLHFQFPIYFQLHTTPCCLSTSPSRSFLCIHLLQPHQWRIRRTV